MGAEYVTRARTVTECDVVTFAGVSGDFNALHTDEEFGKQIGFGGRIAHGLLGLAIASGLFNQMGLIEGTTIAFLGLTWNFKGPIRMGDTIKMRIRVSEKRKTSKPDRGIVRTVDANRQPARRSGAGGRIHADDQEKVCSEQAAG